jgi:hypothetical protein
MKNILTPLYLLILITNISLGQGIIFDEVINESSFSQGNNDIIPLFNGVSDFADIDGDNDLDLIVSGQISTINTSSYTLLYKNDGNGNFGLISNSTIESLHCYSLKFFDIDGDNDNDLITSGTSSTGRFTNLYLNDGLGNFSLKPNTNFIFGSLEVEDVDGDGDIEIFIIGLDNNFQKLSKLYINDGMGNFTESPQLFEYVSDCDIKIFDLDNDNDNDLVYTGRLTPGGAPHCYAYKYTNDGFGNFSLSTDSLFLGVNTGSIDVADIDGDNDIDIIVSGQIQTGQLSTKLYKNDGFGHFILDSLNTFEGLWKSDVKFVDIDNDNDNDIVLTGAYNRQISSGNQNCYSKSFLYTNNGNGGFTQEHSSTFDNMYWSSISIGDIDNDNDIDILMSGKSDNIIRDQGIYSNIYTNNGHGSFSEKGETIFKQVKYSSNDFLDIDNDGDEDLIIIGQDKNENPITELYKNDGLGQFVISENSNFEDVYNGDITYGDIDGDNDIDIIITGKNSSDIPNLTLYKNDGNGSFTPSNDSTLENIFDGSINLSDIDGDGDQDLFLQGLKRVTNFSSTPIVVLYKNDGLGNFIVSDDSTFKPVSIGKSIFNDIDNDGDFDVLIMGNEQFYGPKMRIYKNDGNGNYTSSNVFSIGEYGDFEMKDLNGDNYPDLFINPGNSSSLGTKIYFNDGLGNFNLQNIQNNTNIEKLSFCSVKFIDIDNDGDFDLIQSGETSSSVSPNSLQLYLNNGNGNFQYDSILFSDFGISHGDISISDIDNDQNIDFLISGEDRDNNPFIKLFKNDTLGKFSPVMESQFIPFYNSSSDYTDIDNDGDLDLIICGDTDSPGIPSTFYSPNYNPKCYIYKNDGNGFFKLDLSNRIPNISYGASKFIDIDNDNDQDLIVAGVIPPVQNYPSIYNKTYVLINNGLGHFDTIPHNLMDFSNGTINALDIDYDGDQDLFMTGSNNSKLYINDGNGVFSEKTNPFIGVTNGSVDIGDIDGDNKLDIIVSGNNVSNGYSDNTTSIYKNIGNNNFLIDNNFSYDSLQDPSVKLGDFDNDNDLDIFMIGFNPYGSGAYDSYTLKNDGIGNFTVDMTSNFGSRINSDVIVEDLDEDNDLDIIINGSSNKLNSEVYLNNGLGTFSLLEGTNLLNTSRGSLLSFDIDNDLDKDLLYTGRLHKTIKGINLYRNNSCFDLNYDKIIIQCDSYTSSNGGFTISTVGNHQFTEVSQKICGADSIVNINLTILAPIDTTSTYTDSTITVGQSGASYQWLDCNNNDSTITGDTNQTISPFVNGTYKAQISQNGCIDTSSCITITPCNETEIIYVSDASICDTGNSTLSISNTYENYTWSNGSNLDSLIVTDSSIYSATLSMNNGCITNTNNVKINLFDCALFIDSVNNNVDTCLIDSTTIVMHSYINNITTVNDSVYVTWNFLLNTGDTVFLDAGYTFDQNGVYSIAITINCNGLKASGGDVFYDLIEINHISTSIDETEIKDLYRLSPNPTKDYISITSDLKNKDITIDILSINGALIKSQKFKTNNSIVLNLKELERAIYLVKIIDNENKAIIYKVIKSN